MRGWGDAIRRWVHRYGPPEAVGLATAIVSYHFVERMTGSPTAAAFGGSLGENVGFYATFVIRAVLQEPAVERAGGRTPAARRLWRRTRLATRAAVVEFGPAELLDSFVVRPLAMGVATSALGPATGVPAGKLAADAVFYTITIAGYELRRRSRTP